MQSAVDLPLLWQVLGVLLLLALLGLGVNQTGNETNKNGGNRPEVDGSVEENQARQGNRQLVQRTHHGIGGGGSDSNTPSRTVGDADRGSTGEHHGKNRGGSTLSWEIDGKVSGRPVLKNEGTNQENRDRQQVVVVHGVKVLEVGQLDSDSHVQHEGGGSETVGKHPEVSEVQTVHVFSSLGTSRVTVGSKNRGEDHQQERTQSKVGNLTAKPQDLTVSNQNDSQVLENGVDRDRQVNQGLRGGVNHGNKENRDGKPLLSLIRVKLSVGNDVELLQGANGEDTNNTLNGQKKKIQVKTVAREDILVSDRHQDRRDTVTENRQWCRVGN